MTRNEFGMTATSEEARRHVVKASLSVSEPSEFLVGRLPQRTQKRIASRSFRTAGFDRMIHGPGLADTVTKFGSEMNRSSILSYNLNF